MSGYRRFIAYVYEYQKGKKSSNCGFIKVEVRNQRCRIELHLHCIGIPPESECRTYGFVRKDGLINGILLGNCKTKANTIECLIETDSMNMADSAVPFGKMGGIILLTQSGGFFGTEWDNQPIRPDNFREMKTSGQPQTTPAQTTAPPSDSSEAVIEAPDEPPEEETAEAPSNTSDEPTAEETTEAIPQTSGESTVENTSEAVSQISGEPTLEDTSEAVSQAFDEPITEETTEAPSDTSCAPAMEATASPSPVGKASFPGEEFAPFDDIEFVKCWKIHPNNLSRCTPRVRSLRNNRFLQYGYYNFGHLLLGQRTNGRFVLGVPGGYDQQERFMANMFGFPYFKECRLIELPKNRGGYWYRLIDTPNFH